MKSVDFKLFKREPGAGGQAVKKLIDYFVSILNISLQV